MNSEENIEVQNLYKIDKSKMERLVKVATEIESSISHNSQASDHIKGLTKELLFLVGYSRGLVHRLEHEVYEEKSEYSRLQTTLSFCADKRDTYKKELEELKSARDKASKLVCEDCGAGLARF